MSFGCQFSQLQHYWIFLKSVNIWPRNHKKMKGWNVFETQCCAPIGCVAFSLLYSVNHITGKQHYCSRPGFYLPRQSGSFTNCQTVPCLTVILCTYQAFWKIQSPVTMDEVNGVHEYFIFLKKSEPVNKDYVKSVIKIRLLIFLLLRFSLSASCARPV